MTTAVGMTQSVPSTPSAASMPSATSMPSVPPAAPSLPIDPKASAAGPSPRNRKSPPFLIALALEVRKLRRKHYWLMAAAAGIILALWSGGLARYRVSGPEETRLAVMSMNEAAELIAMFMPAAIGALASRMVTADTEERMGQMMTALGQRPTTRFLAKLTVLSLTVIAVEAAVIGATLLCASGSRITPSYGTTLVPTLIIVIGFSIAVSACQLALSTCVSRQAIGLGAAIIGGLICSILPFYKLETVAWALPWGLTSAASPINTPASYTSVTTTGDVTVIAHPWLTAVLTIIVAAGWAVISYVAIVRKESRS